MEFGERAIATAGPLTVTSNGNLTLTVPAVNQADIVCRFFNNTGAADISEIGAAPTPVVDTTTVLHVLASDDGGEPGLTYTWATVGTPPAAVLFSANGTNASKTTTATFASAGKYIFQVAVTDAGGLSTSQQITVEVIATPSSELAISPASTVVGLNNTQQFVASELDQFGDPVVVSAVWSVNGGGTIDSNGIFQATAVGGGQYTVMAATDLESATSNIVIIDSAPSINITSPIEGEIKQPGLPVTISVNATDDGGISKVMFYSNTALIGTAAVAPFSIEWSNPSPGRYILTAVGNRHRWADHDDIRCHDYYRYSAGYFAGIPCRQRSAGSRYCHHAGG